MSGVASHRRAVQEALDALGLTWDAWPEVVLDPRLDAEVRLSAVLVLLAASAGDQDADGPIIQVVGQEDEGLDLLGRHRRPWEQLPRLRLPWSTATATTAVEAVTASAYDDRRATLALRGAAQVCEAGLADVLLLDALSACITQLDRVGEEQYRIKEVRALARRAVAAATHPELLDLSLLVDGDTWAGPAREAALEAPADAAAPLVRLLCALGGRKPSGRWLGDVEAALRPAEARDLLRRWLELASEAGVVPEWPGSSLSDSPGTLFVLTNTDVVRAAVWATATLVDDQWPVERLGMLARRGAAHNGLAGFPEALSLKVATASVDVLIARGGDAERLVLGELVEDLQRRDLLTKIGKALGRQEFVASRSAELLAERAREQRRKASPAPRKARAAMDALFRQSFGPALREVGFTGGPTWRRVLDDRVDVISLNGGFEQFTGRSELRLTYGVRFEAAHTAEEASGFDPTKANVDHLDLELFDDVREVHPDMTDPLSEAGLAEISRRLREVLVPFLDTMGVYASALAAIETDTGVPVGSEQHTSPDTFARYDLLGRLGLGHGDKATAVEYLTRALNVVDSWADADDSFGDWKVTETERLTHLLTLARRLP